MFCSLLLIAKECRLGRKMPLVSLTWQNLLAEDLFDNFGRMPVFLAYLIPLGFFFH
jgi:hypothetical protein